MVALVRAARSSRPDALAPRPERLVVAALACFWVEPRRTRRAGRSAHPRSRIHRACQPPEAPIARGASKGARCRSTGASPARPQAHRAMWPFMPFIRWHYEAKTYLVLSLEAELTSFARRKQVGGTPEFFLFAIVGFSAVFLFTRGVCAIYTNSRDSTWKVIPWFLVCGTIFTSTLSQVCGTIFTSTLSCESHAKDLRAAGVPRACSNDSEDSKFVEGHVFFGLTVTVLCEFIYLFLRATAPPEPSNSGATMAIHPANRRASLALEYFLTTCLRPKDYHNTIVVLSLLIFISGTLEKRKEVGFDYGVCSTTERQDLIGILL